MTRMQKQIAKNKSGDSSTDVGSKELSTMMTNLDSANQQLFNLREKLEKARMQAVSNEEKISDHQTKNEKLILVAQNYQIDTNRLKDYINATKVTKVVPDRVQAEAESKLVKV